MRGIVRWLPGLGRVSVLAAAAALAGALPAAGAAFDGYVAVGGAAAGGDTMGDPGWRDWGLGRLDLGDGADAFYGEGLALLTLGETSPCSLVLQAAAREGPARAESRAIGVTQLFGKYQKAWGELGENRLALRLGFFFLPSSRENTEVGWSSPYTLTFSALNTWIGEEVRPTGFEAAYGRTFGNGQELTATATVFGGNDTAGAMLAWRGFAMSSRVASWGEVLPLAPLPTFPANFPLQRDGSKSFGDDLDGRPGFWAALRWQLPAEKLVLQADHWDNRGDRRLYGGEYSWATRYDHLAFEYAPAGGLILLGEWLSGHSGMGKPTRAHVDLELEAAYLMASWRHGPFRLSLRRDQFEIEDYDGVAEPNGDQGDAWTAALLVDSPDKAWRFGLEWLKASGEHPAAATLGWDPAASARSIRVELRYYFGS